MKKIFKYIIVLKISFLLFGCGSEYIVDSEDENLTVDKPSTNTSKPIINSSFKIDISKIDGFSILEPIEDQYLLVLNYLRSFNLTCNDRAGFSGPSKPLKWNSLLEEAAKEHSVDMQKVGVLSHIGSGTPSDTTGEILGHSSSFKERIDATGYIGGSGENIATVGKGFVTSTGIPSSFVKTVNSHRWVGVMEDWMVSKEGHCSNIMNKTNRSMGLFEAGTFKENKDGNTFFFTYWTQEFGVN